MTKATSWTGCCTHPMTSLSTYVSHSIASDHACAICYLNIAVPPSRHETPAPSTAQTWKKTGPHLSPTCLAPALMTCMDSVLTAVLDDHAPAKCRRVSPQKNAPWCSGVAEEVLPPKAAKTPCRLAQDGIGSSQANVAQCKETRHQTIIN